MAGIIGNITRENRERKRGIEIMIQKSIYKIEPFDKCYDPKVSTYVSTSISENNALPTKK